jgi:hypothetical protein
MNETDPLTQRILAHLPTTEPDDYTGHMMGYTRYIAQSLRYSIPTVNAKLKALTESGLVAYRVCYPVDDDGKNVLPRRVRVHYRVVAE